MFGPRFGHRFLQLHHARGEVDTAKGIVHRLRAHRGLEGFGAVSGFGFAELLFGEQLILFQRGVARIHHQIILVVNDALEMAAGHVQHQAEARGHALEKPNVRGRHGKIDVPHPLAAHAGEGDLDAATIANDAFVFDALVFAARAFPVLDGAKDAFAKEAAFLGLEGAVVDGLGVFDLALGPAADGLGAGDG